MKCYSGSGKNTQLIDCPVKDRMGFENAKACYLTHFPCSIEKSCASALKFDVFQKKGGIINSCINAFSHNSNIIDCFCDTHGCNVDTLLKNDTKPCKASATTGSSTRIVTESTLYILCSTTVFYLTKTILV